MDPEADDTASAELISMVEYNFTDVSLVGSTLYKSLEESDDHMVSLAHVCATFPRVRVQLRLKKNIKAAAVPLETIQAVARSLRASSLLKISDDGLKVGRNMEFPQLKAAIAQASAKLDKHIIAVSPLPDTVTYQEMRHLFSQFAQVQRVTLPKDVIHTTRFCGSALVQFSAKQDAKRLVKDKQAVSWNDVDLQLISKHDFDMQMKNRQEKHQHVGSKRKRDDDLDELIFPDHLIIAFGLKSLLKEVSSRSKVARAFCSDPLEYIGFEDGDELGFVRFSTQDQFSEAHFRVVQDGSCGLFLKNFVVYLVDVTDTMVHESRLRKFRRIARKTHIRSTILQTLECEQYRNPANPQELRDYCTPPDEHKFRIVWCNPDVHYAWKASTGKSVKHPLKNTNCRLKLHFMTLVSKQGAPSEAEDGDEDEDEDEDAEEEDEEKFNYYNEMDYLLDYLEDAYPKLTYPSREQVFTNIRASYDKHLSNQSVLGRKESLELMVASHEQFGMEQLLLDMRKGAMQFAQEENCPCEKIVGSDLGEYKMRADDVRELVCGILGPTFDPEILVKEIDRDLYFHEIALYVNNEVFPVGGHKVNGRKVKKNFNCSARKLVIF